MTSSYPRYPGVNASTIYVHLSLQTFRLESRQTWGIGHKGEVSEALLTRAIATRVVLHCHRSSRSTTFYRRAVVRGVGKPSHRLSARSSFSYSRSICLTVI
jgi:hypothetical protein